MAPNDRLEIRRSQAITPFGVGAIIEIGGESFVACDIHYWGRQGKRLDDEPRLLAKLGVRELRTPPAKPDRIVQVNEHTPTIPVMRFPSWFFCEKCRRMYQGYPVEKPMCPDCERRGKHIALSPMRFVVICTHGHLSDVDWVRWAHSGKVMNITREEQARGPEVGATAECRHKDLEFRIPGRGIELTRPVVRCRKCHRARTLEDLVHQETSRGVIFCSGRQPWQGSSHAEPCTAKSVLVVPRGATNVTFPSIMSSIDIPPNSDFYMEDERERRVKQQNNYTAVREIFAQGDTDSPRFRAKLEDVACDSDMDQAEVLEIVRADLNRLIGSIHVPVSKEEWRYQEYGALLAPDRRHHPRDRFIKHRVSLDAVESLGPAPYSSSMKALRAHLGELVLVTRLREIRVLAGFSRVKPYGDENLYETLNDPEAPETGPVKRMYPDLGSLKPHERWYPAVEVFGEGVFFTLNAHKVKAWAEQPALVKRVQELEKRRQEHAFHLPSAQEPAMVLLHTLAHVLIRQLTFDCGYGTAALRERLYYGSKTGMLGALIYTADGDSEGTLGGLVRQGQPKHFLPTFLAALQYARWCSSDPLCIESHGQGLLGLNLGACHACSLLPETSCELNNSLLDRATLIGTPGTSGFKGYFSDVLEPLFEGQFG
jgi:hypothetical protein